MSALPYIAPLLILQIGWWASRRLEDRRLANVILWCSAAPLCLVVGLRGNVGTDTATYRDAFEALLAGDPSAEAFEPGFLAIATMLLGITRNGVVAVNVLSIGIVVVMVSAARRIEGGAAIFVLTLAPAFLFDMSMNGLRYGLAFGVGAHAVLELSKRRYVAGAILALVAGSIHASAVLVVAILSVALPGSVAVGIVTLAVGVVVVALFGEELALKLVGYEVLLPPSELTGLAPLAVTGASLGILVLSRSAWREVSISVVLLFAGLAVGAFEVARVSYAGVRMQFLVLFCVLLYLQLLSGETQGRFPRWVFVGLWLVGVLAFSLKLRNFYDDYGVGESPFLPYASVLGE